MLKYELKKIYNKKINKIMILTMLVSSFVLSVFAMGSFKFVDKKGEGHKGITASRRLLEDKNQWRGTMTKEKIEELIELARTVDARYPNPDINDVAYGSEIQSYYEVLYSMGEMLYGEDSKDDYYQAIIHATPEEIVNIYTYYVENLQKVSEEYGITPEKLRFLKEQYEKIEIPLFYEAADAWDIMILYVQTFGIILLIINGYIAAGIFSEEFRYKADSVYFSTRYGRDKAVLIKILSGVLVTTLMYWIGMGLMSLVSFGVMGTSGGTTPYQFFKPYAIYHVTYGEMYGIAVVCGYVASLLSASIAMFLAAKGRSMAVAVTIPFVLFCVSPFIGRAVPFKRFFTLTPDQLVNVLNCGKVPYIYQIGELVFRQIPFIILFYLAIAVIVLPLIYKSYHRA